MATIYEVYEPHTHGPEGINSAWVISRHRTPEAAERAIEAELRRLRRQPGHERSWLQRAIRAKDASAPSFSVRPVEDADYGKEG